MSKSLNKWYATFLVCILIVVIAGCTSEETSKENGSDKDSEKEQQITVSIYDRGNVPQAEGTIEDNRWTKWINEQLPVQVDFVPIPRNDTTSKFNTLFAAGDAPDLILDYNTGYLNTLDNQNLLMPLDELIEEHSKEYKQRLEDYPILRALGTNTEGELVKLGRINRLNVNESLLIRKDWLDNLGLEVPKTAEELFTVAEAFAKQDPDGNGQDDTFGIDLGIMTGKMIDAMFQNVEWVIEGDEFVKDWERAAAATKFKKRLFDEGIVNKDFLNNTAETINQDIVTGKLGIFGFNSVLASKGSFDVYKNLKANNPEAELNPILLPETQFGSFNPMVDNPVHVNAAVNADAENPEAVIEYVDFIAKEDTTTTLEYGFEGEHYEVGENGCSQIIDQEKFNNEVSYNGDMRMLSSFDYDTNKCGYYENQLVLDDPIQKEFYDILMTSQELYLDPARPFAEITHQEHFPTPPQDVQLILTNVETTIVDLWNKAIVSGDSYTPDQAEAEVKSIWESAGGQKVEDWYAEWYQENKDSWFFGDDMYEFVAK